MCSAIIKCWGLVTIYQNNRAIKMYTTSGYSTDDFMTAFHRFTANHGNLLLVVSDAGSQMKRAGTISKQDEPGNLDWDCIRECAAENGMNLIVITFIKNRLFNIRYEYQKVSNPIR